MQRRAPRFLQRRHISRRVIPHFLEQLARHRAAARLHAMRLLFEQPSPRIKKAPHQPGQIASGHCRVVARALRHPPQPVIRLLLDEQPRAVVLLRQRQPVTKIIAHRGAAVIGRIRVRLQRALGQVAVPACRAVVVFASLHQYHVVACGSASRGISIGRPGVIRAHPAFNYLAAHIVHHSGDRSARPPLPHQPFQFIIGKRTLDIILALQAFSVLGYFMIHPRHQQPAPGVEFLVPPFPPLLARKLLHWRQRSAVGTPYRLDLVCHPSVMIGLRDPHRPLRHITIVPAALRLPCVAHAAELLPLRVPIDHKLCRPHQCQLRLSVLTIHHCLMPRSQLPQHPAQRVILINRFEIQPATRWSHPAFGHIRRRAHRHIIHPPRACPGRQIVLVTRDVAPWVHRPDHPPLSIKHLTLPVKLARAVLRR